MTWSSDRRAAVFAALPAFPVFPPSFFGTGFFAAADFTGAFFAAGMENLHLGVRREGTGRARGHQCVWRVSAAARASIAARHGPAASGLAKEDDHATTVPASVALDLGLRLLRLRR